jgi:hypothetical protein
MRVWTPLRRKQQLHHERIRKIEVRGLEHVRAAMRAGGGTLITPNHPGHADCYLLWDALLRLPKPPYVMTAWQVFEMAKPFDQLVYRQHGCFSVDREGTDLNAFRLAVQVLQSKPNPLVIFPEGDVYHLNDRVTSFREGTGSIVMSAIKRGNRPVACVPCALRYEYLVDPTPELHAVMNQLDHWLARQPDPRKSLALRIAEFHSGMLARKEREYLGASREDGLDRRSIEARTNALADHVLSRLEQRYKTHSDGTLPERVKEVRQQVILRRSELVHHDPSHVQLVRDLDDLFFVIQLFSYPADYVEERPSIERMAETIDKFEEDFLGFATAQVRGVRRGYVEFGDPLVVRTPGGRQAARELTFELEQRVQGLLDRVPQRARQATATIPAA